MSSLKHKSQLSLRSDFLKNLCCCELNNPVDRYFYYKSVTKSPITKGKLFIKLFIHYIDSLKILYLIKVVTIVKIYLITSDLIRIVNY